MFLYCNKRLIRLIKSVIVIMAKQENLRLVFKLFSLMRSLPSIRFK